MASATINGSNLVYGAGTSIITGNLLNNSAYSTMGTYAVINNNEVVKTFFTCFTEKDFLDYLSKVKEKTPENYKYCLCNILESFHFSEEFLLNFIEEVDFCIFMQNYGREISSGEYSQLALYKELKK